MFRVPQARQHFIDVQRELADLPLDDIRRAEVAYRTDHECRLLHSMCHLAAALTDSGQPAEAMPLCKQALALQMARVGPDHEATLTQMGTLAVCHSGCIWSSTSFCPVKGPPPKTGEDRGGFDRRAPLQ